MPRMGEVIEEGVPVHLLLLGDSKSGKSHYVAQAALDGFTILYVDADNGKNTLRKVFQEAGAGPEVLNRVIMISCQKGIYEFFRLFTEQSLMRWNLTQDRPYAPSTPMAATNPDDIIIEIRPAKIPKGVIVVFDSWTSVALAAMRLAAGNKSVSLTNMGAQQQAVYGEAGIRLTQGLDILQVLPAHIIVQAHGQYYERQERPTGAVNDSKQGDMIVKETIQIPLSASKPHGHGMLKFFNEVGWLIVDRFGKTQLDFTRKYDRVGGGSVNRAADPSGEFRFSKLFAEPIPFTEEQIAEWYKEYPASEIAPPPAPAKAVQATPATQTQLPAAGAIQTGATPPSPNPGLAALMKAKTGK